MSGSVQHAVQVSLTDVAGWGAILAAALEVTGGAMTAEERQWADRGVGAAGVSHGVTLDAGPLIQLDRGDRRVTVCSPGRTRPTTCGRSTRR